MPKTRAARPFRVTSARRPRKAEKSVHGTAAGKTVWRPGTLLNPVPVVLITSQRPGGKPNIITVAWVGTVCSDPPMVGVSIRPQRYSHDIIAETGQFVVNLPSRDILRAVDFCGVKSGRDADKFAATGLTPLPAARVAAPLIRECPVHLECRVRQVIRLGSHDLFLAEVMGVQVDASLLDAKGRLALERAGLVAYVHGHYWGLGEMLGKFGFSVQKRPARHAQGQRALPQTCVARQGARGSGRRGPHP